MDKIIDPELTKKWTEMKERAYKRYGKRERVRGEMMEKARVTYEQVLINLSTQVTDILREHGIRMSVAGCGCCGSPIVSFEYRGELIVDNTENLNFNMFAEG